MLGHPAGPRIGAAAYSSARTYLVALALLALRWFGALPVLTALGLVWAAHVGFGRMLGWGLRHAAGLIKITHLSGAPPAPVTAAAPATR